MPSYLCSAFFRVQARNLGPVREGKITPACIPTNYNVSRLVQMTCNDIHSELLKSSPGQKDVKFTNVVGNDAHLLF